jgi:PAS domain S-box-containing protein
MINRELISKLKMDESRFFLSICEAMREGVVVADSQGRFVLFNTSAREMFGLHFRQTRKVYWRKRYGIFLPDQVTPYPVEQFPLWRAIRGETVDEAHMFVRHRHRKQGCWLSVNATPWRTRPGKIRGAFLVSREVTTQDLRLEGEATAKPFVLSYQLTRRQREIVVLIATGKTNKEIAALLGIHFKTVVAHRSHIMRRLNIHETAGLTRYAIRKGLIQP